MFKGMFYMIIMNMAVMFTMYIFIFVMSLFGIDIRGMMGEGYIGLFIFAAIFGFWGSIYIIIFVKVDDKKNDESRNYRRFCKRRIKMDI